MSRQGLQQRIRPQRYDLGLELPVSLHLREGQQMSSTLNLIFEYIMFEKCNLIKAPQMRPTKPDYSLEKFQMPIRWIGAFWVKGPFT